MTPQQVEQRVCDQMSNRIWQHAIGSRTPVEGNAASKKAARALIELLVVANGLTSQRPMCELMERAGYTYAQADEFVHYIVDSCMNGGSSSAAWSRPSFRVRLDGDRLTWDGGHTRNPPRGPGTLSSYGPRILLLEDDPVLQSGTARMIGKIFPGVKIITTDNVDAAIAYLRVHPIEYIVSDVDVLGDKSGIDLFYHVRDEHPELVDKFLFFTGNDEAYRAHDRVLLKGDATIEDMRAAINAPMPSPRTRIAKTASPPPRDPRG